MVDEELIASVIADLERVQNFDAKGLEQRERLGSEFQFSEAVSPTEKLISLFQKIPSDSMVEFPEKELKAIQSTANSTFNIFDQILSFDVKQPEPGQRRDALINQLDGTFQQTFSVLFPFISYAMARTVDFNQLSTDGRAAVQGVKDDVAELVTELNTTSEEATRVLTEVRELAAEHGVTQQAKYFSEQATKHERSAAYWLKASIGMAVLVLLYAISTLFFPYLEIFQADSNLQAIQLLASKFLVFAVLSFGLFQTIKNYQAHRHNAIMNNHRQNALLTYKTLAEAGGSAEARDTVLQHAAAAIYAPSDSGYMKSEERGYGGNPVVGFTPRSTISAASSSDV